MVSRDFKLKVAKARTRALTGGGLDAMKELYEENWDKMCRFVGNKKYIGRERYLNKVEVEVRKELGLLAYAPLELDKPIAPYRYGEKTLLDFLHKNMLTKGVKYDILNCIDGND